MMGNKNDKRNCDTVVGVGSNLKGEIVCKGPSRISGEIEGKIFGDDLLLIGEDAVITGEITGNVIEINGTITGTVSASHKIMLNETAKVDGDIEAPSVIVEEGARFNGKSSMPVERVEVPNNVLDLEEAVNAAANS